VLGQLLDGERRALVGDELDRGVDDLRRLLDAAITRTLDDR
jgi:hypothetical protein